MIYEDEEKQYANIWRYGATITESNVGKILRIDIEAGVFKRFYIYLDAYKKGFLARCRKVIGVYGYHLKGRFKG